MNVVNDLAMAAELRRLSPAPNSSLLRSWIWLMPQDNKSAKNNGSV